MSLINTALLGLRSVPDYIANTAVGLASELGRVIGRPLP